MIRSISRSRYGAAGLSLVELMVAILIGSILMMGLVQVFAASRTAYQLSQGVARAQENGRFAMDFLLHDLRMVGHSGCVNDQALTMLGGGGINQHFNAASYPLRFDVSLQGYEANGTGSGVEITLPAAGVEGAGTDWTPALPAELLGIPNGPIAGSDVIVLRFLAPIGTTLSGFAAGSPATVTPTVDGAGVTREFAGTRSLFGLADCQRASIFQATTINATTGAITVAGNGLNTSTLGGLENYGGGQAVLYRAETVAYYVALNPEGAPALYRVRWEAAPGVNALTRTPEELVEGIETLQIMYGRDSAPITDPAPTGYMSTVATADALGDPVADNTKIQGWRRVGAVQLGMIARSTLPSANNSQPKESVLGTRFVAPDDKRYRATYENTVALRNRMFGN